MIRTKFIDLLRFWHRQGKIKEGLVSKEPHSRECDRIEKSGAESDCRVQQDPGETLSGVIL